MRPVSLCLLAATGLVAGSGCAVIDALLSGREPTMADFAESTVQVVEDVVTLL